MRVFPNKVLAWLVFLGFKRGWAETTFTLLKALSCIFPCVQALGDHLCSAAEAMDLDDSLPAVAIKQRIKEVADLPRVPFHTACRCTGLLENNLKAGGWLTLLGKLFFSYLCMNVLSPID